MLIRTPSRREFIKYSAIGAGSTALVAKALADEPAPGAQYLVSYAATLSSAAGVVTVQQPASGGRNVQFVWASLYSSVACAYTFERDGTAATMTAGTVAKINPDIRNATATVFTASDVGAGTNLGNHGLAAGAEQPFNLDDKTLHGDGTAINFTIRTAAISGDVKIVIAWKEINR